jgi:hypothetical protein
MLEALVTRRTLERLSRSWVEYQAAVPAAARAGGVPAAGEKEFFDLQARIAADLERVTSRMSAAVGEASMREALAIHDFLKRQHLVQAGEGGSTSDREAFEREWHAHYIFLGQLKGASPAAPARAAGPPQRPGAPVPTGFERGWLPARHDPRRWLRFVIQLGALGLLVYVLGSGLGIRMARDGRFSFENPGSLGNVVHDGLAAFNNLWVGFFGTLAGSYGTAGTLVLLGLLVAIVGYWVFRRA